MHFNECSRCIVTERSPGVLVGKDGVCNICKEWDKHGHTWNDFDKLGKIFKEKVEETKGKYKYDVLVGLSGGKDGAYLVYALKEIYKLNVLAVTADYGFMPNDFAKRNAERVTKKLGVDHIYLKVSPSIVKKLIGNYLRLPNRVTPCHMCTSVLGVALAYKAAVEYKIPKLVTGLDRGQLFSKLHLSHAKKRVLDNIEHFDAENAEALAFKAIKGLNSYFSLLGLSSEEKKEVLPCVPYIDGPGTPPEILMYFLFHPYDENKMKNILVEKADWERPQGDAMRGHFDCDLKTAAACAPSCLGLGERLAFELSVDVREGMLSRDEALKRLENEEKAINKMKEERPYLCLEKTLNLSEARFALKVKILSFLSPFYSKFTNFLLRKFGFKKWTEKLIFLIRPH